MRTRFSVISTVIVISIVSLVGCATTIGTSAIKDVTQETVTQKIHVGQSSKQDVINLYGQPPHTDFDEGPERWVYVYGNTKQNAASYVPFVGLLSNHNETDIKELHIVFDKKGIVSKASVTTSHGEAHGGLLN